jgi:hypothetical protein
MRLPGTIIVVLACVAIVFTTIVHATQVGLREVNCAHALTGVWAFGTLLVSLSDTAHCSAF